MDYDMDLDDVTAADVAAANKNSRMTSTTGSVKVSPYSSQGAMAGSNPPHPQVAAIAGRITSQSGHPMSKFGTGDK